MGKMQSGAFWVCGRPWNRLEAPHLDLFEQGIAPEQRNEGVITERD
jgi:hypothetical protein